MDFVNFEFLYELRRPWWMEICFAIVSPLGYLFLCLDTPTRGEGHGNKQPPTPGKHNEASMKGARSERIQKALATEMVDRDAVGVVRTSTIPAGCRTAAPCSPTAT